LEIHYHPGKANVVADALSRKSQVNLMVARPMPYELAKEFDKLSLGFLKIIREESQLSWNLPWSGKSKKRRRMMRRSVRSSD
jgi:hypothetical protein